MERKILGTVLLVLGVCGLIVAGMVFVNGNGSMQNIIHTIIYIISGSALFFTGLDFVMPQREISTQQEMSNKAVHSAVQEKTSRN